MNGKEKFKNMLVKIYEVGTEDPASKAVSGVPDLKKIATDIGKGLSVAALSFLLARAPAAFSSLPFGFALFASLERYVPFAYFGAVTAAIFNKGLSVPLFILYSAHAVLRVLICRILSDESGKKALFRESIKLRVAGAALISALFGLYRMISGGFLFYDMFGALFALAATPALTLMYCFFICEKYKGGTKYILGFSALCFSLIFALREAVIFGFSLSVITAVMISLYIAGEHGALRGAVAGLVCGAACSPSSAIALSAAGLFAGVFWEKGELLACTCACGVSLLCSVYTDGIEALTVRFPDLFAAMLIFVPLSKYVKLPALHMDRRDTPIAAENLRLMTAQLQQKETALKLESLSSALSSLSETFFMLSDRQKRPSPSDIGRLCGECFEKNCKRCAKYRECWSKDYLSTTDIINKVSEKLYSLGRIEKDDIPKYMKEKCPEIENITEELNCAGADMLQAHINGNKTEIFAIDYEFMSKLLAQAITEGDAEYEKDEVLTSRVEKYMGYMNFHASCISVCGKRKKSVHAYGVNMSKLTLSSDELCRRFERLCGVRFKKPKFNIQDNYVTMDMDADSIFKVNVAKASSAKNGAKINGDSVYTFTNRGDYFYALLCDGMGSGKEAAITSRLAGIFLKKMLEAGNRRSVTFEMLNSIIRQKGSECSSTVDLLEIDLLCGNSSFIKSGAASSYVLRDGRIFNISAATMPIGITKEMNAEEIKFTLEGGDTVIMLSDGVAQGFEDGIWLADMLSSGTEKGESLQDLADRILLGAELNNPRSDDMTAVILQIEKK